MDSIGLNQFLFLGSIVIILIVLIVFWLGFVFFKLFRKPKFDHNKEIIQKKWKNIESHIKTKDLAYYKVAIIEADNLLDFALKSLLIPGSDLGQRLKVISARQPEIRFIWEAHKIRNKLAHEHNFVLKKKDAERAIKQFKKALQILGFL